MREWLRRRTPDLAGHVVDDSHDGSRIRKLIVMVLQVEAARFGYERQSVRRQRERSTSQHERADEPHLRPWDFVRVL